MGMNIEQGRKTDLSPYLDQYSQRYLKQYWPEAPEYQDGWTDNIVLMGAYQEAAQSILGYFKHPVRALDVSTGPALGPLLGMHACVSDIQLSDFQEDNRVCISRLPVSYWRNYVPMLERTVPNAEANAETILQKLDILRRAHEPVHVDLFRDEPFPPSIIPTAYPLIMMHFVADGITDNKDSYFKCLKRVTDMIAPGAAFAMSAIVDSSWWKIGETKFPSPHISENEIADFLSEQGLSMLRLDRSQRLPGQTYDGGWIVVSCFRPIKIDEKPVT